MNNLKEEGSFVDEYNENTQPENDRKEKPKKTSARIF